jgi:hypothetical protein
MRRLPCSTIVLPLALFLVSSQAPAQEARAVPEGLTDPTRAEAPPSEVNISAENLTGKATLGGPMLRQALSGPMRHVEEVVFAVRGRAGDHYYSPFGYTCGKPERTLYNKGPSWLCRLNLRTGQLEVIFQDPKGAIRYPHLSHDAKRIVMSYRKAGSEKHHLYRINTDGTGLTQLTGGDWNDLDPIYLPDGDIVFVSDRCHCWVGCWVTPVAVLYRCGADGTNMRRLSANVEHESAPWPMPDGRILFTRWEYTERALTAFHHLWTVNPDGTGAMTYYGNSLTHYRIVGGPKELANKSKSWLFIDAKPIPDSNAVVSVINAFHGNAMRSGMIARIRPEAGPDQQGAMEQVSPPTGKRQWRWRDPYPFSEDCFLACVDRSLVIMDGQGNYETLFELEGMTEAIHEVQPLVPRPREKVIPSRVDLRKTTGTFVLQDVTQGRRMQKVQPGAIRKLLVMELLPWGVKPLWDKDNLGSTSRNVWMFERVVGTVPVEPDGSAHFQAPANRPLFFVALDENDECVKRMQSLVEVQPGETVSCVGCHEHRVQAPPLGSDPVLQALGRAPSPIAKIPGVPESGRIDFPRDIQPMLDKHCVGCHGRKDAPKGVTLVADRGPTFSHSYTNLLRYVGNVYGRSHGDTPPYQTGSGRSRLYQMLKKGHKDVKLSRKERNLLRLWIDSGACWPGTYAAIGSSRLFVGKGQWGKGHLQDGKRPNLVMDWDVSDRRCAKCHVSQRARKYVYKKGYCKWPTDDTYYNLDHPEQSLLLMAPLAKEAGGQGLCKAKKGVDAHVPVFASKQDPDYRKLLAAMRENARIFREHTTYERPGFIPSPHYVREMKRAGALDADWKPGDPLDPFAVDRRYLQQYWPKGDTGS